MILQPQEIEVWYLIPAVRRELARYLLKKGFNQKNVAKIIGTTEASVSHYIKSKRGNEIKLPVKVTSEIEKSAARLANGSCIVKEIQLICNYSKKTKFLCELHEKYSDARLCRCGCCL